jgi:hypothetical protein
MSKKKWTRELIIELLQSWHKEHNHPRFDAKTFFVKNGLKVKDAKTDFAFTITRPDITAGVCGDVASCAGVLSVERDNPDVLKAFFFKKRAYLVMNTGEVLVRAIPKAFHDWIQEFDRIVVVKNKLDGMKGHSPAEIEIAKKGIEMLRKSEMKEGRFQLVPPPERKRMTGKALLERRRQMKKRGPRSGEHVHIAAISAYRSLTVSKLMTAAVR